MGFKIFSKKNGKRTVNDKPENGDTKVTEASDMLPNTDPEAAKKGTTIRVLWTPKTANTYCWIQGEVTKTSVSEAKNKKGTIKTNKVTIENLILVECFGDEYCDDLPPKIQIELSPKQNWALGPEATLSTGEENEAIRIDTDAIPKEIQWNNDDLEDETEEKGAAGGVPVLQKNSSNQCNQEDFLDSEDESADDETDERLIEEEEEPLTKIYQKGVY